LTSALESDIGQETGARLVQRLSFGSETGLD